MTMPFVSVSKGVMNVELKDFSQLNATLKILKVGIESFKETKEERPAQTLAATSGTPANPIPQANLLLQEDNFWAFNSFWKDGVSLLKIWLRDCRNESYKICPGCGETNDHKENCLNKETVIM